MSTLSLPLLQVVSTLHDIDVFRCYVALRKFRVRWKTLCIAAISLTLSQGFSTFHDIDVFRCCVAEISDNLAGDKRLIVLIISVL